MEISIEAELNLLYGIYNKEDHEVLGDIKMTLEGAKQELELIIIYKYMMKQNRIIEDIDRLSKKIEEVKNNRKKQLEKVFKKVDKKNQLRNQLRKKVRMMTVIVIVYQANHILKIILKKTHVKIVKMI